MPLIAREYKLLIFRLATSWLLLMSGVTSCALPASASNELRTIAINGDAVPGVPATSRIRWLSSHAPALGDHGHVAFSGALEFPEGPTGRQIIVGSANGLEAIATATRHEQAPGTSQGVYFDRFEYPVPYNLNRDGRTVVSAFIDGPGVRDDISDVGLWSNASGTMELVVRGGDPAVGAPLGMMYWGYFYPMQIDDQGTVTFIGQFTRDFLSQNPRRAIWRRDIEGSVTPVILSGDPAPGFATSVSFSSPRFSSINNAGQLALTIPLYGDGVTSANDLSVWAENNPGSL